jgi:hypothetical protein
MGFLTITEIVAEVQSGLGNHNIEQLAITGAAENDGLNRVYRFIDMTMLEVSQLRLTNGTLYRHRELEETNSQLIYGNLTTVGWPVRAYATNPANNIIPTPTLGVISARLYDADDFKVGWRLDPIRDREEFEDRTRAVGIPRNYAVFAPTVLDWYGSMVPAGVDATSGAILLSPPPSMTYDGWVLEVRRYRYPRLTNSTGSTIEGRIAPTSVLDFGPQWDEVVITGALARAFKALNLNTLADAAIKDFARLSMDVARRQALDAEDLDFGPLIEIPIYQARR